MFLIVCKLRIAAHCSVTCPPVSHISWKRYLNMNITLLVSILLLPFYIYFKLWLLISFLEKAPLPEMNLEKAFMSKCIDLVSQIFVKSRDMISILFYTLWHFLLNFTFSSESLIVHRCYIFWHSSNTAFWREHYLIEILLWLTVQWICSSFYLTAVTWAYVCN